MQIREEELSEEGDRYGMLNMRNSSPFEAFTTDQQELESYVDTASKGD